MATLAAFAATAASERTDVALAVNLTSEGVTCHGHGARSQPANTQTCRILGKSWEVAVGCASRGWSLRDSSVTYCPFMFRRSQLR